MVRSRPNRPEEKRDAIARHTYTSSTGNTARQRTCAVQMCQQKHTYTQAREERQRDIMSANRAPNFQPRPGRGTGRIGEVSNIHTHAHSEGVTKPPNLKPQRAARSRELREPRRRIRFQKAGKAGVARAPQSAHAWGRGMVGVLGRSCRDRQAVPVANSFSKKYARL